MGIGSLNRTCWQPTVAAVNASWRPMAIGRWLWTSSGWYWYSIIAGAGYHYGRWYQYPACGWVWVPGAVWGPSWVTWRYTDGYCGWAPLPPHAYYSTGSGLTYHNDSVHLSFGFGFGYSDYCFVPWGRFCDYYPYHHYVHGHAASVIYNNSTVVNRYGRGANNSIVNQGMAGNWRPKFSAEHRRGRGASRSSVYQSGRRAPRASGSGRSIHGHRPSTIAGHAAEHGNSKALSGWRQIRQRRWATRAFGSGRWFCWGSGILGQTYYPRFSRRPGSLVCFIN
jgi:hypothetical protein